MGATVIWPSGLGSTCTNEVECIDCCICSPNARSFARNSETDSQGGWSPHTGFILGLEGNPTEVRTRQLVTQIRFSSGALAKIRQQNAKGDNEHIGSDHDLWDKCWRGGSAQKTMEEVLGRNKGAPAERRYTLPHKLQQMLSRWSRTAESYLTAKGAIEHKDGPGRVGRTDPSKFRWKEFFPRQRGRAPMGHDEA